MKIQTSQNFLFNLLTLYLLNGVIGFFASFFLGSVQFFNSLQNNFLQFSYLIGIALLGSVPIMIFVVVIHPSKKPLLISFLLQMLVLCALFFINHPFASGTRVDSLRNLSALFILLYQASFLLMLALIVTESQIAQDVKNHIWKAPVIYLIFIFVEFLAGSGFIFTACFGVVVLFLFLSILQIFSEKYRILDYCAIGFITVFCMLNADLLFNYIYPFKSNFQQWPYLLVMMVMNVILFFLMIAQFEFRKKGLFAGAEIEEKYQQQMVGQENERRRVYEGFMGMLIHEVKTPLSIIQIAAISLSRRYVQESGEFARIAKIEKAVLDINEILNKCMQASDIENNSVIVVNSIFDTNMMREDLGNHFESKQIEYQFSSKNQIFSDYTLIKTILINLLSNALKYAKENSSIRFECHDELLEGKTKVKFSVKNKVGIAGKPDAQKVFVRHYRSDKAHQLPGSGLGLWLSQEIAKLIGSHIYFDFLDEEVVFSFYLKAR